MRHKFHQLYVGCSLHLDGGLEHARAAQFGQQFPKHHGHPDRVFLEKLRWDEAAKAWTWDNVWWEYAGGRRVRYSNYREAGK